MHTITAAHATEHPTLFVRYSDGLELHLDLAPLLERGGVFTALRDPAAFVLVRPGARGRSLAWDDEGNLELDADALRLPEGHPDKPDGVRELSRDPKSA